MKKTQTSEKLREWVKQGLAFEKSSGLGQNAVARMLERSKSSENQGLLGGQVDGTFMSRLASGMVPRSVPVRIDRRYVAIAKWLEKWEIATEDAFFEELEEETFSLNLPPQLPQSNPSPQESVTVVLRPGQMIIVLASHPNEPVHVVIYGVGVKVEVK